MYKYTFQTAIKLSEYIDKLKHNFDKMSEADQRRLEEINNLLQSNFQISKKILEDVIKINNKNKHLKPLLDAAQTLYIDASKAIEKDNSHFPDEVEDDLKKLQDNFLKHLAEITTLNIGEDLDLGKIQDVKKRIEYHSQHLKDIPAITKNFTLVHPNQLVLVHKTRFLPQEGVILANSSIKPYRNFFDLLKREVRELVGRATIHFSLNGAIGSFGMAHTRFHETKYAVLVPFVSVQDRIRNVAPDDTWIVGNLKLPAHSYVLYPEDEETPFVGNATPVPYSNDLGESINKLIKRLGYSLMIVNASDGWIGTYDEGFGSVPDSHWLARLMEVPHTIHATSFWIKIEDAILHSSSFLIKTIKEKESAYYKLKEANEHINKLTKLIEPLQAIIKSEDVNKKIFFNETEFVPIKKIAEEEKVVVKKILRVHHDLLKELEKAKKTLEETIELEEKLEKERI